MSEITIKIPEEIRKYKERVLFGLTGRQIICVLAALAVCAPIVIYGRGRMSQDTMIWLIFLISMPILACGFIKKNGLPLEKYVAAWVKFELIYPRKRKFCTENAWRIWQKQAEDEDAPQTYLMKRKYKKDRLEASLEKAVLIMQAEQSGNMTLNVDECELITVSKDYGNYNKKGAESKKPGKTKNDTGKSTTKEPKFAIIAKQAEEKLAEDPRYKFTKKEFTAAKKYNDYKYSQRKRQLSAEKKRLAIQNKKMEKRRKAKSITPRSVQQSIPFVADYDEGLFEVTPGRFSKMYKLKDINFSTSKGEEQEHVFLRLAALYNYFTEDVNIQVTVDNKYISAADQEQKILYKMAGDGLDSDRVEFNDILRRQIVAGRNNIRLEKYLTVSIEAETPIEALLQFHKIDAEIVDRVKKLGSYARLMSTTERLSYYHDKFRKGREGEFAIDFDHIKQQGICSKDYIAPSYMEFQSKHIQIDDDYYRILYINNLPKSLQASFFCDLITNDFEVTATLSIQPLAQEKAVRVVMRQLTGIETDKMRSEQKAVKAGHSPDSIRHEIKNAHKEALELQDDVQNKDQKLFYTTITLMVHGNSLDDLNENCKIIAGKCGSVNAQVQPLSIQQEEGMRITLPFGYVSSSLAIDRTLTTEALTVFVPFKNEDIYEPGGIFYGLNQISLNLILLDRFKMQTPSGFILGTSGSGKSFATKQEMLNILLNSANTSIIVIDPENEYGGFCRYFGGTVIKISADSMSYINPMDMTENYGLDEDDPEDLPLSVKADKAWKKKVELIMSIVDAMLSGGRDNTGGLSPAQKTIVDKAVEKCYAKFFENDFDQKYIPTLEDMQAHLDEAAAELGTPDAINLKEATQLYTTRSMNIFANRTNINLDNRLVVFNVRDLGAQLQQIALTVVFDFVWNKMVDNKNKGNRTYCYCDEVHVMFKSQHSANFLKQLYKRGRKYGLCITGMTQDLSDLLNSDEAQSMIKNSQYIMMLRQSPAELGTLAHLLKMSDTHLHYVHGADEGCGLIFAEGVIVPFVNRFPIDSHFYKLMSTKFKNKRTQEEIDEEIAAIKKAAASA